MVATSIFNGTADDIVGGHDDGSADGLTGKVLWSQVRNGIGGPLETFFDARATPEGSATVTDSLSNTWNVINSADIVAYLTTPTQVSVPASRRSNIVDYDNDGLDKPVTGLAIIGEGEANAQRLFYLQDTKGEMPLWESKLTFKDTGEDDLLIERGEIHLTDRSSRQRRYKIELDPELEPRGDQIKPGDNVRVVIRDKFTQQDSIFWVGRRRVTLTKQQQEHVTVEVTQ